MCKVGAGHAGFGKMLLQNHKQFNDLKSIIALNRDYLTAERYYEGQYKLKSNWDKRENSKKLNKMIFSKQCHTPV